MTSNTVAVARRALESLGARPADHRVLNVQCRRSHHVAAAPYAVQSGGPAHADLEDAQSRKLERLLDQTGVHEGSRVLEIGSGWGELAIRAARRGARVTTITLSSEQKALAEKMGAPEYFRQPPEVLKAEQKRSAEIEARLMQKLERWEALEAKASAAFSPS